MSSIAKIPCLPGTDLKTLAGICSLEYGSMDHFYRLEPDINSLNGVLYDPSLYARGIEVNVHEQQAELSLSFPEGEKGIFLFYRAIAQIAQSFGQDTVLLNGESVSVRSLNGYARKDIARSRKVLAYLFEKAANPDFTSVTLFGVRFPLALGAQECRAIGSDLERFERWLNFLQQRDVYYAAPMVFSRKDGSCFGAYALMDCVATVLPDDPSFLLDEKMDEASWYLMIDSDFAIPYSAFLDQCQGVYFDAEHQEYCLKSATLRKLFSKSRIPLDLL